MDCLQHRLVHALWRFFKQHQRLSIGGTGFQTRRRGFSHHRRNQAPADGQLVNPGLGYRFATRRRDDGRIRRTCRVAQHTVAKEQVHGGKSQRAQIFARLIVQTAQAFDTVDLGR